MKVLATILFLVAFGAGVVSNPDQKSHRDRIRKVYVEVNPGPTSHVVSYILSEAGEYRNYIIYSEIILGGERLSIGTFGFVRAKRIEGEELAAIGLGLLRDQVYPQIH